MFIESQEAYEILIDNEKRLIYDKLIQEQSINKEYNKQKGWNGNSTQKTNKSRKENNSKGYQIFKDWVIEIRRKAKKNQIYHMLMY